MLTGHHYPLREVLLWTRRDILTQLLLAAIPTVAFELLEWRWLAIPWLPIALLGTAVAFVVGFKNNASYDRLWEARRIYGAIVNASRAFGLLARDFVSDGSAPADPRDVHRVLFERHFAWLTALRYELREPRSWESITQAHNAEYRKRWFHVDEQENQLGPALRSYLSPEEYERVMGAHNKPAQVLALQSAHLAELARAGWTDPTHHVEVERVLIELLAQQGAAERIKNFPYPRQYATLNLWFVQIFVVLLPLGMLQEFAKLGPGLVWLSIPFSALAGWIFMMMERIGESSESPFEGSANDVPITAMSRAIEIDLRQMLGQKDVPPPTAAEHQILT